MVCSEVLTAQRVKQVTTSQYYRDLLTQSESVQENITQLLEQKQQAEQELFSVKTDIKKEKLKNSASDVGSKLIKAIGFTIEQTARLLSGKRLLFIGSLYSEEHKHKFDTENSTIQIAQDSEVKRLHLVVDGKHIGEWFNQKQKELLNSRRINIKELKNNRGMKI